MRIHLAFVLTILSFLGLAATASAQSAPPPGPYNESCQSVQMKGSTLHAKCQTVDGKWVAAKLDHAEKCADGVINLNGVLSCQAGLLPPGSYVGTCADVRLEGTTLRANCPNSKNVLTAAELKNANQCKGDIANQNGALKCVAPGKQATQDQPEKKEKKKKRFVVF